MGALPRFEEVLALGRKLVHELGQEPPVDTLARWMAHYVAELIDGAENAPPNERGAAQRGCFETILKLWDHRTALPDGRRPFERLEPIMRALESLDPNDDTPRYFRPAREAMGVDGDAAMQSVLDFVNSVDDAASITIAHSLVEAARLALDEPKEWATLAERAEVETGSAGIVVSFVSKKAGREQESERADNERRELADRIERVERFGKLAARVCDDLRERLDVLTSPQGVTEGGTNGESGNWEGE